MVETAGGACKALVSSITTLASISLSSDLFLSSEIFPGSYRAKTIETRPGREDHPCGSLSLRAKWWFVVPPAVACRHFFIHPSTVPVIFLSQLCIILVWWSLAIDVLLPTNCSIKYLTGFLSVFMVFAVKFIMNIGKLVIYKTPEDLELWYHASTGLHIILVNFLSVIIMWLLSDWNQGLLSDVNFSCFNLSLITRSLSFLAGYDVHSLNM